MPASFYLPTFFTIVGLLCLVYSSRLVLSSDSHLQEESKSIIPPLILSLFFIVWLGFRPVSGVYFGDTLNYANDYKNLEYYKVAIDWHQEWFWSFIMVSCKTAGMNVNVFFTIIEAGYILSVLWAIKKFLPSNPMIGMLFIFSSLMFFSFGTNGLRNGLACHIILLAIAFFFTDRYFVAILLALMAFGIHRSVMLPIVAVIAARYIIKDFKWAIYIWVLCLIVSIVAGGAATGYVSSLGFDDRLSAYNTTEYQDSFSATGFRFDFLIYSLPPIILGWYLLVKLKIQDDWYKTLCIAYCLCNAFWVIVIRMAFSNRFAYLSWFMYPVLIAYPLVNLPIWEDQDRKMGVVLLGYCAFSMFMNLLIW